MINVLVLRAAMSAAAITVLPNAVGAQRTPILWAKTASTA